MSDKPSLISGFHAHVYYNEDTFEQARQLCESASDRFGLSMGRMHTRPVGPHPCWSCQLAFRPDMLGDVMAWLALNRNGLVIFAHPETGDDLADHTAHAIWMGKVMTLDLSVF